jgi:hypothetical protein
MKGPALSALALAAVAGAAKAGGTDTPNEYLSLDRELEALSGTLAAAEPGVKLSGYFKTNLISRDGTAGGPDTLGTQLTGVRVNFAADVTDAMKVKISIEGSSGNFVLRDAFGFVKLNEAVNLTMGQYRAPLLFSASASDEKLVFYDRSTQGAIWNDREPGVMFDGKVAQFRWYATAFNGGDGTADEFAIAGHVAYDVQGPGIIKQEGGFGVDAETAITLGATYLDEGTLTDGTVMAFEAMAVTGPVFLHGEVVDYDDGFVAGAVPVGVARKASGLADTTPFGVTAAYMFTPAWEAALRFNDNDDQADTSTIAAGLNYYVNGHNAKWQLNFLSTSSDNAALDVDTILLGLVLGF